MKPLMLRHLEGEKIGRFPAWMMRQAGRYLDSYQEIRREHGFWEMVTTPDLAAKVSLLPLAELPVDGVIFFSDILTLPYGLDVKIELKESIGPVLETPLRNLGDFDRFELFDAKKNVPFVGEALQSIRSELSDDIALLGFAGAPWTVACYLIEGNLKKKQFQNIKGWLYQSESDLKLALDRLGTAT